ncbi:hypothetical protein V2J09_019803 [Rumex salicifolius]
MENSIAVYSVSFYAVPEGCIAAMVAFTSPRDACRLAVVSKVFRSASESDVVWERFLPSDCEFIVSRSDGGEELLADLESKKQLYMYLANRPLLVDDATKSFWLEKSSGKKCWMLSARSLSIIWSCTPRYWKWTPIPESRFPEVAELIGVCWLEIRGAIKTSMLSPETRYAAYLVFKMTEGSYGFDNLSETSVSVSGGKTETQNAYLTADHELIQAFRVPSRGTRGFHMVRRPAFDPRGSRQEGAQCPKPRTDGWQELNIGEFFTHLGEDDEIELSVLEVKGGNWKGGLIVEGIELRPVSSKQRFCRFRLTSPEMCVTLRSPASAPVLLQPCSSPKPRKKQAKLMLKCSILDKNIARHIIPALAVSCVFLSQTNQVLALSPSQANICLLASAANSEPPLPIDELSEEERGRMMTMMSRGMSTKNFDPVRYSGRWFEVASLKRGFAGQGQEDCHCTQGVYTFNMEKPAIQVDTFCVHGSPDGYITGIRGNVQCLSEEDTEKTETDLERREMIKEKCYLRFPTLPFIPKEPYDVIATDYDNFALVSGAKDKSFVQIYSRTPNPGGEFIEKYKNYLADFGYDPSKIKDTPQDCEVMSNSKLAAMMSMDGMQQALTNQFPDIALKRSVQFDPLTSVFETLKKLGELYFKQ